MQPRDFEPNKVTNTLSSFFTDTPSITGRNFTSNETTHTGTVKIPDYPSDSSTNGTCDADPNAESYGTSNRESYTFGFSRSNEWSHNLPSRACDYAKLLR